MLFFIRRYQHKHVCWVKKINVRETDTESESESERERKREKDSQ